MKAYLLRRFVGMATVLLIVSIAVFGLMNFVPGDPIVARYGEDTTLTKEQEDALRRQYGLDRPLPVQYAAWLRGVVTLDFGRSITQRRPVSEMIAERLPVTMQVQGFAFAIILVVALPAGIVAAVFRNSLLDRVVSVAALAGVAMPGFWLGILLIMLFAVKLGWLPVSGYVSLASDPGDALRFSLLPALTAALGGTAAVVMRQTRSSLLEVLDQDYVRTARSKGLPESRVIFAHALRNAMLPVATVLGLAIGQLLAGSVIIERIFTIPGMGRLAVDAIFQRDFPVIQAVVLLLAGMVVLANLLTDLAYAVLDPRIRYS
jgi:peptide/nickel transport system permease protein